MSERCRSFREALARGTELGARRDHSLDCEKCAVFASALAAVRGAGVDEAPSNRLFERLRSIPEVEERRAAALESVHRLPLLALPAALRERLRRILPGRPAGEPPAWVFKPRYAIAASYLATVILGAVVGNPAAIATEAVSAVRSQVGPEVRTAARSRLSDIQSSARARFADVEQKAVETYRKSKTSLAASARTTRDEIQALAERVLPAGEPQPSSPEPDPADPKGDSNE